MVFPGSDLQAQFLPEGFKAFEMSEICNKELMWTAAGFEWHSAWLVLPCLAAAS